MLSGIVRRVLRILLTLVVLLVVAAVVVGVAANRSFRRELTTEHRSRGLNAVWAAHDWVSTRHSAAEYGAFAEELRRHEIIDVFAHVGPLDRSGTIPSRRYRHARRFVAQMHAAAPRLRVQAWIGQVERRGGGPLDVSSRDVRRRIVRTAKTLLDLGFDGIHYNVEPIFDGDPHWLALLDATGEVTRRRGGVLSIAGAKVEPFRGVQAVLSLPLRRLHLWSPGYYRAVAERVDQIAVMTHDSAMPFDFLYASLVARSTKLLLEATPQRVTLFVGVPTHEEWDLGHQEGVETIGNAVRGLQQGLQASSRAETSRVGVALYAHWTTEDDEWAVLRERWLPEEEEGAP